jgi:hypothetical protein
MALTGGHSPNPRLSRITSASIRLLRRLLGGDRAELLIKAFGYDDLRSLYYLALLRLFEQSRGPSNKPRRSFSYYEFGVAWGFTLTRYVEALKAFCRDKHLSLQDQHIVLFDSFEGLPPKKGVEDDHPDWSAGSFAHTVDDIKKVLREERMDPEGSENVRFVKGFYENTLTPELRQKLMDSPPDIVTIDCDYYSSTKTVLDWLRPILRSGSLLYFDDIWSFDGNPNRGELKAINEFNGLREGLLIPFDIVPALPHLLYLYVRDKEEETRQSGGQI